jgi:hypothetical protein
MKSVTVFFSREWAMQKSRLFVLRIGLKTLICPKSEQYYHQRLTVKFFVLIPANFS